MKSKKTRQAEDEAMVDVMCSMLEGYVAYRCMGHKQARRDITRKCYEHLEDNPEDVRYNDNDSITIDEQLLALIEVWLQEWFPDQVH